MSHNETTSSGYPKVNTKWSSYLSNSDLLLMARTLKAEREHKLSELTHIAAADLPKYLAMVDKARPVSIPSRYRKSFSGKVYYRVFDLQQVLGTSGLI